jgi:hypothetical protein
MEKYSSLLDSLVCLKRLSAKNEAHARKLAKLFLLVCAGKHEDRADIIYGMYIYTSLSIIDGHSKDAAYCLPLNVLILAVKPTTEELNALLERVSEQAATEADSSGLLLQVEALWKDFCATIDTIKRAAEAARIA